MRKLITLSAGGLMLVLVACGSAAPTPADVTVCHEFNTVMGTQPATHTWTLLESAFDSGSAPDAR